MTHDRPSDQTRADLSRRVVLRGAAVSGLALPLVAACGSDSGASSGEPATSAEASGGGAGGAIATSDVPVGGGLVVPDQQVVVTQPQEGEFLAFTAVCTHQQCTVATVEGGTINCPCHGSKFSIEDGSVVDGPAPSPLEEKSVSVEGDSIVVS
ncbi:MAG TPA: Rieske (2Fe-2S) protein [Nocardioidaceae bacterium]|nr:Rieske (2Fe-2S) protein [Nocardioidaceae bacterium]HSE72310.1 Rieske (2Fe-2S) protein [Nocardioidaceae bacterium]